MSNYQMTRRSSGGESSGARRSELAASGAYGRSVAHGGLDGEVRGGSSLPITLPFVLHVVRQWWNVATPVGLVLVAVAATIVWISFEPAYRATAWVKIENESPFVAFPGPKTDPKLFVRTQLELLRSPMVVERAVADKEVAQLPEIAEHESPSEWLSQRIAVEPVGQSELFHVTFDGPHPQSAALIVNKLLDSYFDVHSNDTINRSKRVIELLEQEKSRRAKNLDSLRNHARELAKQATGKETVFMSTPQEVVRVHNPLAALEDRLTTTEVEREVMQAQAKAFEESVLRQEVDVPSAMLDAQIEVDPEVANLKRALLTKQSRLHEIESTSSRGPNDPSVMRAKKEVELYQTTLAKVRAQLRENLGKELKASILGKRQDELAQMQARIEGYRLTENLLEERITEERSKLAEVGDHSLELEFARGDLTREELVFQRIADRAVALRTELEAPARVSLLKRAEPPKGPVEAIPSMQLAAVSLVGFGFPFLLAVCWERLVRRIAEPRQILQEASVAVVGEVATFPARTMFSPRKPSTRYERHLGTFEESIDSLRTSLVLSESLNDLKVLAITSAVPEEGKTSLASQMVVSLARSCREPVLLIDADMRDPDIHQVFEISSEPGLVDVLDGRCSLDGAIVTSWSEFVHLLPSGHLNKSPHVLLANGAFERLLEEVRGRYRYIVIDTPPILPASEALVVAKSADGVLVCTMRDVSRGPQVRLTCQKLQAAGAEVIGAVLIGIPGSGYAHKYGAYSYAKA